MQRNEDSNPMQSAGRKEDIRTGLSVEAIRQSVLDNLYFHLAKSRIPQRGTTGIWHLRILSGTG